MIRTSRQQLLSICSPQVLTLNGWQIRVGKSSVRGEDDASRSQSSRSLSTDGIAIDARPCPVDENGTLRFWDSRHVGWSTCANHTAHIMAQSPIAQLTANNMAPVIVVPDPDTPCANAPVSTAYHWHFLSLSSLEENQCFLST